MRVAAHILYDVSGRQIRVSWAAKSSLNASGIDRQNAKTPEEVEGIGFSHSEAMRVLNASPIDASPNSRNTHFQRRERSP